MTIQMIPLAHLWPHPAASNVLSPVLTAKLTAHLARSDRYPPIIVRPVPHGQEPIGYQILDGRQRAGVLKHLGKVFARCVVWDVDDQEALVLLASLNALHGKDDPRRRAALVEMLIGVDPAFTDANSTAGLLPETAQEIHDLRKLLRPPAPAPPKRAAHQPVSMHFFLQPDQRRRLDQQLRRMGGERATALLRLVGSRMSGKRAKPGGSKTGSTTHPVEGGKS